MFHLTKARYNPKLHPHMLSAIASTAKYFMAHLLTPFCHNMPIDNPAIDPTSDSKDNHSGGREVTKVLCNLAPMYESSSPLIIELLKIHF
jgi:hypothetical protein